MYGPHATGIACSGMYVQWYSTKMICKCVSGQNNRMVGKVLRRVLKCTQEHQRCRRTESQPWHSPVSGAHLRSLAAATSWQIVDQRRPHRAGSRWRGRGTPPNMRNPAFLFFACSELPWLRLSRIYLNGGGLRVLAAKLCL